MNTPWTIRHPDLGELTVSGFKNHQAELRHTLKHYLGPAEQWVAFDLEPSPRQILPQMAEALAAAGLGHLSGPPYPVPVLLFASTRSLVEAANPAYLEAIRQSSATSSLRRAAWIEQLSWSIDPEALVATTHSRQTLCAVTGHGIFLVLSAKNRSEVSEIRTAYRVNLRGDEKSKHRDFLRAAIKRFADVQATPGSAL